MLQISDLFSGINEGAGILDLQTALGSQGTDLQNGMSIPIYDVFYLKIAPNCNPGMLCSSVEQYNNLDRLSKACGAVSFTVNLLDTDLLTLLGAVCIYLPSMLKNGGMYIFIKDNIPDLTNITEELATAMLGLTGKSKEAFGYTTMNLDLAVKVLHFLIELLIKMLNQNMQAYGIAVYDMEKIPVLMQDLYNSGDYTRMLNYRRNNNLINPAANSILGGGNNFA